MQIRADDGTLLEVQEATVLDTHNQVIWESQQKSNRSEDPFTQSSGFARMKTIPIKPWMIPLVILVLGFLLVAGAVASSILIAVFFALTLIRGILRLLNWRA